MAIKGSPKKHKPLPAGEVRRWLGLAVLAVLVAGAAYLLDGIVNSKARQLTQSEISAVADQAIIDAEAPVASAAKTLADLARGGGADCLRDTLTRFAQRLAATPLVTGLNLVDANGYLMCSTGDDVGANPAQMLPALTPRMPPVTIAVDPRPAKAGLLVSWTATTGVRLVAELAPDQPRMPVGPALTLGRLAISIKVNDRVWRASGAAPDPAAEVIAASAAGKRFPITAEVATAAEPTPQEFRDIETAIKAGAALIIGALFGVGWFGRESRPKRVAVQSPNSSRATLAYRPVIEITNGTIVGIDVVAEGSSDAAVADIHFIDRVLTEAAPILRVHPTLKLSLPSISNPRELTRLASSLAQALPRFSVQPGQVVVAAMPAADHATAQALDMVRAAGVRLSLDGIASGGAGLMALARHRPDFITIGGELAAESDPQPQALTILQALVGIARDMDVGVIMRDVAEIEQIERLRGVGITTATGPAFGPALKAHLISSLVAAATLDADKRVRVA